MTRHNPRHPGEFIASVYLEPNGITGRELASRLRVSPSTLNRILTSKSGVSPEMAMQHDYGLWQTRKSVDLSEVERLKPSAA